MGTKERWDRWGARVWERTTPGRVAPWIERALGSWVGWYVRLYHRPTIRGWENLPATGAFLLVGNHSGSGTAEGLCLAWMWQERFGASRPLTAMSHVLAMAAPGVGRFLCALGLIPSTRAAGLQALGDGVRVLIFPGGDHETWRPLWRANQVDLAGRQGFLRLARDAGVPIVPLAIQGAHHTVPILWRSRVLSRLAGLKRMPITALNVALGLASAWWAYDAGAPWSVLAFVLALFVAPLWWVAWVPWTVRMEVGAPILAESIQKWSLERTYEEVEGSLQRMVTDLSRGV